MWAWYMVTSPVSQGLPGLVIMGLSHTSEAKFLSYITDHNSFQDVLIVYFLGRLNAALQES